MMKILTYSIVFLLSAFSSISILAQESDSTSNRVEEGWIEKLNNKIAVDVSFNNSYETFEVQTPDTKFTLYPNTSTNLKLNVNYRFISIGVQYSPDFLLGNGDERLKGKTKSFELSTTIILKHWFTKLSYSKVKGYYLENTADFITRLDGEPYIQLPDLNYFGFSMSTGYSSNSKFSFRSLTSQTERQLKSAGSFIPVINLRYYVVDDKSDARSTQKSNNLESSIGPGYIHTFVYNEKFYISIGLQGSVGYIHTKLTTRFPEGDLITNQNNYNFRWDAKAGFGYNGRKLYTGMYSNFSGTEYRQDNTTAVNIETRVFYHIFLGIRLPAPESLNRKTLGIEKKLSKKNK